MALMSVKEIVHEIIENPVKAIEADLTPDEIVFYSESYHTEIVSRVEKSPLCNILKEYRELKCR
jgi:hypothetical protein